MSRGQFEPGNSKVTKGYVHDTDNKVYQLFGPGNTLRKVLATISLVTDPSYYISLLTQVVHYVADVAAESHVLDAWTLGNLSYETAKTFASMRHWVWHLWYIRIPQFLQYAENYANGIVSSERYFRKIHDIAVQVAAYNFAYTLYRDMRNRLSQAEVALESLEYSYYDRNKTYIGQVLRAAQAAAKAAYNNSTAYTDKVRQQLVQYANQVLQQSKNYTDQRAQSAENNAVKKADLFTSGVIAALVAGIIAEISAQQAELAAAEAADAAWIAGEGALLQEELGLFGKDLKDMLDAGFIGMMAAYVAFGVVDAKDTGDVTADVLVPILTPISDGVKTLIGLV